MWDWQYFAGIFSIFNMMREMLCKVLSVPHNTSMDQNNATKVWHWQSLRQASNFTCDEVEGDNEWCDPNMYALFNFGTPLTNLWFLKLSITSAGEPCEDLDIESQQPVKSKRQMRAMDAYGQEQDYMDDVPWHLWTSPFKESMACLKPQKLEILRIRKKQTLMSFAFGIP